MLPEDGLAVSYMIPFDATDTWIVAACDQYDDYETLLDPWVNIIAHSPQYHGVKIKIVLKKKNGHTKSLIEPLRSSFLAQATAFCFTLLP